MSSDDSLRKVFLVGRGISHSFSLSIQNAAFKKLGIYATYELRDLSHRNLLNFISTLRKSNNVLGLNVTVPFKEEIIPFLSSMDKRSKSIGAINTIRISGENKMQGYNTDYDGIMASLAKIGALRKDSNALLLGAGGAARACITVLLDRGYDNITILNRTLSRARRLEREFKTKYQEKDPMIYSAHLTEKSIEESISDSGLIINAISHFGSDNFPAKLNFKNMNKNSKVFDLSYRGDSLLLEMAKKANVEAIDGLLMLVVQAAKSFEIWTGKKAPLETMMRAAKKSREFDRENR